MHEVAQLLVQQARRFASSEIDARAIDADADIPSHLISRAAEIGLFGLSVPEAYGGVGLGLLDTSAVVAELARHDRSVAVTVGLHSGLGTRPLADLGAEALKARWLPRLASGEAVASFCATEPSAGSDLTAIRTTATVEGDELVLSGEKSYVTNGGFAGVLTVLARTPGFGGARGTSLLLVPRDTEGVTIGAEEHKLGIRGSSTVTVHFDGARLPLDHTLGEPGKGLEGAHRALEWGRTLMSAGCIGTARAALDLTRAHASTRRQFGRPLAGHPGVQEHLAWMAGRLFAMEAMVERAGRCEERGDAELASAASMAKVFCSEGAFEICDRAIQLHGALGFVEDSGVALLARDCRVTRIFEGANDVLLMHLGIGLVTADGRGPSSPGEPDPDVALAAEREVAARLATTVRELKSFHGVSIVREQHAVCRLARADLCLVAARAAFQRARRERGVGPMLADHVGRALVQEAARHLDAVARASADAERDRAVVEALADPSALQQPNRAPVRVVS